MANYRAVANGNWSSGATWGGGAVPPNGEGHNIYSNSFTVTIDQNVDVALITNAAITASFVGGGTSAAQGGSFSISQSGFSITFSNLSGASPNLMNSSFTSPGVVTITGTISGVNANNGVCLNHTGTGKLVINGNITGSNTNSNANGSCVVNSSSGSIEISGNVFGGGTSSAFPSFGALNSGTGSILVNGNVTAGNINPAISNSSSGIISLNGVFTALNNIPAIISGDSGVNRLSGSFVHSSNGTVPFRGLKFILNSTPVTSYVQMALDGVTSNSFVRYFTADNSTALNQAAPTDVRSGVAYGISNSQTGRLTIPARGTVANGVTVGPNMPFTATRSGTTATATLAYSYPYQVGDVITVTGASNAEWDMDYTITEVVSGTSVRWTVPATHSATAGTGANMQTKGTAVLDGASVAAAVWGAATRTLTSASGPTAVEIRQEMDTNSTKLANLDATVSSRLAASAVNTTRLANVATVESTGAALAAALTAP